MLIVGLIIFFQKRKRSTALPILKVIGGGLEPIGTQEDDMKQPSGRLETLEDRRAEKPGGRVGKWEGEYPRGRLDPTQVSAKFKVLHKACKTAARGYLASF